MSYDFKNIAEVQTEIPPEVYGKLDLGSTPERFRTELGEGSVVADNRRIKALLEDKEKVEFFRQLTLMGDPLADAYATLFPKLGFKKARQMLDTALEEGIDKVPDAPQELVDFIAAIEEEPEWVDWEAIEHFAKRARLPMAVMGELMIRLPFMMTYINGYQGLPMIMTGTLTSDSAAKRMKETISTFKMAMLPGAMRKGGVAFNSAAKVRIMHAMVRVNLLRHPEKWDFSVYGTPIPQVDQMGAALQYNYAAGKASLKRKRFSSLMRPGIEQSRYLAFLLGMHDQFLSDNPKQIVETWEMCRATLRHKFDDRAKDLNRATVYAYRRLGHSPLDKLIHALDVRTTRFMYRAAVGKKNAQTLGVKSSFLDIFAAALLLVPLTGKLLLLYLLSIFPGVGKKVDDWAIREIERQLDLFGEAEYKTDVKQYRMQSEG